MFDKIKEQERFCFQCPFCGKENSFGFKVKELKRYDKKFKKEMTKQMGHELSDIHLVESWGCKNCEIGFYSIVKDYQQAYLEIKAHAQGEPTKNIIQQMSK